MALEKLLPEERRVNNTASSYRALWFATLVSALLIVWLAASLLTRTTHAQEEVNAATDTPVDRAALHQSLLDLNSPWTVMCIAAHPDDEDGTSLTVLRHKYGVHTVTVFSTFGEGGQNAVGPQLYEELGVIRARETMAAAAIQGSESYFLGLKDFGFSKSADEAFRVWGHEEALRRMVLKIRELRPDVIITNHDTTSGHGHHQATGRLLLEAFVAAADAKRFPEQLKEDVEPWQVKRMFVRTGFGNNSGGQTPDENGMVSIDPNEKDQARGTTYAEQALQALQKHETQGPWPRTVAEMARFRNSPDGRLPLIRYRLTREAKDIAALPPKATTFLDGLQLSARATANLAPPKLEDRPLTDFENEPERVLAALIAARKSGAFTRAESGEEPRAGLMQQRLDHALAAFSGISLTITSGSQGLIPAMPAALSVNLGNNGSQPLTVSKLTLHGFAKTNAVDIADQVPPGAEAVKSIEVQTPAVERISVPAAEHLYDGRLFGERFVARAEVEIDGAQFPVSSEVKLDVTPAVEIRSIMPAPFVFTPQTSGQDIQLTVQLVNHLARNFDGSLAANAPHFSYSSGDWKISGLKPGEVRTFTETLHGEAANAFRKAFTSRRNAHTVDITVRQAETQTEVTRKALPGEFVKARVVKDLKVGFIPSFDQTLEWSLTALGVNVKKLSPSDLQESELKTFAAVIIDNRGYEAHPELVAANPRLLAYVDDGGTLIVFYHKNNEWNPDPSRNRPQLAPYPITLGGERVTDENAAVSFLQPGHRLLNFPNRIQPADFLGWIQERGLYYPKEWDAHYAALLAMNDPGEPSLRGGLLVGSYGQGHYIYTSLVWYRELRAGIPGAYRMLANMISYGHK